MCYNKSDNNQLGRRIFYAAVYRRCFSLLEKEGVYLVSVEYSGDFCPYVHFFSIRRRGRRGYLHQ
jgi:hypothetical protein